MLGMDKLATDNFSTVLTKNLRNPRDYAPLKTNNCLEKDNALSLLKNRNTRGFNGKASNACRINPAFYCYFIKVLCIDCSTTLV